MVYGDDLKQRLFADGWDGEQEAWTDLAVQICDLKRFLPTLPTHVRLNTDNHSFIPSLLFPYLLSCPFAVVWPAQVFDLEAGSMRFLYATVARFV